MLVWTFIEIYWGLFSKFDLFSSQGTSGGDCEHQVLRSTTRNHYQDLCPDVIEFNQQWAAQSESFSGENYNLNQVWTHAEKKIEVNVDIIDFSTPLGFLWQGLKGY